MPNVDDFDALESDAAEEAKDIESYSAPEPNRAGRRKKNRGKGQGAAIPANAPEPQDHLAKQAARVAEATSGAMIVLTLWDAEIRIEQSELFNSWDFQLGTVQNNPLMMVKGLLGDKRFAWFAARSRADGKTPIEAANEVMQMFARATGFDTAGK